MNGTRPSSRLSVGAFDDSTVPTHSQLQTTKRKGTDDFNPLSTANKRVRKETLTKDGLSNKRNLNGGKEVERLVAHTSSARPPPSQGSHALQIQPIPATPRASSRAPPDNLQSSVAGPSHPPANNLKANGASSPNKRQKGRGQAVHSMNHDEPEVDEDVRQIQSETASLRRQTEAAERSLGSGNVNPAFQFPMGARRPSQPPTVMQPLAMDEAPAIERNRFMRGEVPHRRRSSVSRGKRASTSYENTGIISQPHTSVPQATFYKHIDADLPESQRARQLLVWCSHRAMTQLHEELKQQSRSTSSLSTGKSTHSGKDPPEPLSEEGIQLLKRVEESVIRMLAEKKIDTNIFRKEGEVRPGAQDAMKENEQNVRNRERERKFNASIQRSAAEEETWAKLLHDYEKLDAMDHADVSRLRQELAATSDKSKGKRRASAEEVESWDIPESDLPEHFRGPRCLSLARGVVMREGRVVTDSAMLERLKDLEFKFDRLHSLANSALEATRISQGDLDQRFALLNLTLTSRSQPSSFLASRALPSLSSYLPTGPSRAQSATDPQDLLRALSRVDAERPPGDAARRAAREVQRMGVLGKATVGGERKLTDVPPPTPKKPLPGTPKRTPARASTPGRGR